MVELKVNVDGVLRIVCGVSEATKCQDVVLALAQATGQIGRFNLVEKCQDAERSLRPQESPLRVMSKWGANSKDSYFLLRKTGTTPGNSRPPSVTREMSDRFRQVSSPVESVEGFPQRRQASVRRSQTFSGYRGRPADPGHRAEEAQSAEDQARHLELQEVVSVQQERLANQYRDLVDIENIIQALVQYATEECHQADAIQDSLRDIEVRSKRNKAELRELEFWESELEIEHQLQSALAQKMTKLKGRIEQCDQELALRHQEIDALMGLVAEQREQLRRNEDSAAESRLAEMREEITLLEQEHQNYTQTSQEMESTLAEMNREFDDKRAKELQLAEELARENMKELPQPPSGKHQEESVMHSTQSMPRQSQRWSESSSPPEMYATFPFRRLVSARQHTLADSATGDNPEGIFV